MLKNSGDKRSPRSRRRATAQKTEEERRGVGERRLEGRWGKKNGGRGVRERGEARYRGGGTD